MTQPIRSKSSWMLAASRRRQPHRPHRRRDVLVARAHHVERHGYRACGAITNVEFFTGTTPELVRIPPHRTASVWHNVPVGSYTLTAKPTDDHGLTKDPAPSPLPSYTGSASTIGSHERRHHHRLYYRWQRRLYQCQCFQAQADQPVTLIRAKVVASRAATGADILDAGGAASRILRATGDLTKRDRRLADVHAHRPARADQRSYYWLAIWSDDCQRTRVCQHRRVAALVASTPRCVAGSREFDRDRPVSHTPSTRRSCADRLRAMEIQL